MLTWVAKKGYLLFTLIFVFFIIGVSSSCSFISSRGFLYNGKYPPIKTITINENGQNYAIEAVSGQVIIIFNPTISHVQAIRFIKNMKGIIIGQMVDVRYYLVDVGPGNESNFINQIKNHPDIRFVSLNAFEYPCAAPQTSVIDNFYMSHGNNVTYALQECGLKTKVNKYNVGIKGDESGRLLWSDINFDLHSVLKNAPADTPLIINMSFGPGFTDPDINYWTDKNITEEVKNNYRKHYKEGLKDLAAIVSNYQEKDFVIVKAAGNEGLKNLDIEILNDLGGELSDAEFNILNNHLILVGAEDNRNKKYSNTVSSGSYNFLYTAVDISDLKYKNEHLYGTSFAAPRVSCFISSTVNKHNIKATDTLKAVKEITYKNPDQLLTQEDLEREAKIIAANKKNESKENSNIPSKEVKPYKSNERNIINDDRLPNNFAMNNKGSFDNLAGTSWGHETGSTSAFSVVKQIIKFENNNQVTILSYFGSGNSEENHLFEYSYDAPNKRWIMYQTEFGTLKIQQYNITIKNNVLTLSDKYRSSDYKRLY
ncbi:hypothetical protein FACS1894109_06680 [Spirochaetia bacterium]|nr:hypothetical protein FACS1894109_06680 [Spirochaetia bacterium]